MRVTETSFKQTEDGFEHMIHFEFQHRLFIAVVVETDEETYVDNAFYLMPLGKMLSIDIPKYFGAFSDDVYRNIYDNIQRGFL